MIVIVVIVVVAVAVAIVVLVIVVVVVAAVVVAVVVVVVILAAIQVNNSIFARSIERFHITQSYHFYVSHIILNFPLFL